MKTRTFKPHNQPRASRARLVLSQHAARLGTNIDAEGINGAIVDLFTDLMHLCDLEGVSIKAALSSARAHHKHEQWAWPSLRGPAEA